MQGQYRSEILDGYSLEDAEEFLGDDEKEILIPKAAVESVVDSIESDVREIIGILANVKGLTEIDDAKEHLDILAEKLY